MHLLLILAGCLIITVVLFVALAFITSPIGVLLILIAGGVLSVTDKSRGKTR